VPSKKSLQNSVTGAGLQPPYPTLAGVSKVVVAVAPAVLSVLISPCTSSITAVAAALSLCCVVSITGVAVAVAVAAVVSIVVLMIGMTGV
jgi:hypothetical protein